VTPSELEAFRRCYPTTAGFAELSKRSVYGEHDLHHSLKDLSWFELNLYGITGRRFSPVQVRMLNYLWLQTSYADVRIWPNRIAALAGSARSTPLLALVGGMASCDAELFVATPLVRCLAMLRRVRRQVSEGEALETLLQAELDHGRTVYGFGRPIASVDERVPHLVTFLRDLDADHGECLRLAFRIEAFLLEAKQIRMNIGALLAAVCADLGFDEVQMHLFSSLLVFAGMPPCYRDAKRVPPGGVLPLRCDDVRYTGVSPRKW